MKKYKLWWPIWFLFLIFWACVCWPVALILFFAKLIADHFMARWAGTMLALTGAMSSAVALSTVYDSFYEEPFDIALFIMMLVFAIISIYIVFIGINRNIISKRISAYLNIINRKRNLSLYELSAELNEPDMDRIKANMELLSGTMIFMDHRYDRAAMRINIDAKDPDVIAQKTRLVKFNCASCKAPNEIMTAENQVACEYCDTIHNVN